MKSIIVTYAMIGSLVFFKATNKSQFFVEESIVAGFFFGFEVSIGFDLKRYKNRKRREKKKKKKKKSTENA